MYKYNNNNKKREPSLSIEARSKLVSAYVFWVATVDTNSRPILFSLFVASAIVQTLKRTSSTILPLFGEYYLRFKCAHCTPHTFCVFGLRLATINLRLTEIARISSFFYPFHTLRKMLSLHTFVVSPASWIGGMVCMVALLLSDGRVFFIIIQVIRIFHFYTAAKFICAINTKSDDVHNNEWYE